MSASIINFRNRLRRDAQEYHDLESIRAQSVVSSGSFMVSGAGEAEKTIYFSSVFSRFPPSIMFSVDFKTLPDIKHGQIPNVTPIIIDYVTENRNPPFSVLYRGAKILVKSTGPNLVKFVVNWQATGIGFNGPME